MTAPSWQTVGIIFATLASLGPIADRFLLARHRERLHDRFTDWWIKLDDTRIPNLPLRMAQMTVGTLDRVFGKKSLSLSSLSTSAILSVLFTAMAITVSSYAFLGSDYYRSAIDERGEWIAFNTFRVFMNERIRNWPIYVFNIPFDIISVLVSVKLLSVASRCAPGKSALIIVLDVAIAFLLAASSSTLIASWYMRSTCVGACPFIPWWPSDGWGELFGVFPFAAQEVIGDIVRIARFDFSGHPTYIGLFGATTLIPTLAYGLLLVFLSFGKVVLAILRKSGLYYLERATDEPSKAMIPFTLLSTTLVAMGLVAKLLQGLVAV